MNEITLLWALNSFYINCDYRLFNTYIYGWESDFFCMTKSDYAIEVEVKISRSDFKNDFKHKTDKHELFKRHKEKVYVCPKFRYEDTEPSLIFNGEYVFPKSTMISYIEPFKRLPNRFYYCVPKDMITVDELPPYAGLLYWHPEYNSIHMIKQAPFLHKQNNDLTKTLLDKFHWKTKNLRSNIYELIYNLKSVFTEEELERIKDSIQDIQKKIYEG